MPVKLIDICHVSIVKNKILYCPYRNDQTVLLQIKFYSDNMLKWSKSTYVCALIFLIFSGKCFAKNDPPFYSEPGALWADSILKNLTREERIAQLIMVAAWSNKDSTHIKDVRKQITNWGIGGLIFFQGGPVREALLTNDYQKISKVPLFIGMDAEWGLAMRLDSTIRFPRQMTISAIQDDSVVYVMGKEVAENCKRLGIQINFAPDADINNNPANPVIGSRSFGDVRESVATKSIAYMNGLQDQHILATGKHFPGHGSTDSDSHFSLPLITRNISQIDSLELYPFRELISSGVGGMMVAHLNVPSLDSLSGLPTTLSSYVVTDLLKQKMGFNGLIFTDALNMKGVSSKYAPGIVDKMALISGNDVLLYSEDVRKAIEQIHYAVENCEITQDEIDARAKKVLMAKYWCGLNKMQLIDTANLINNLNNPQIKWIQRKLYQRSITLLSNKDSLLPFRSKDSLRIASVVIGDRINNTFQEQLKSYESVDVFSLEKDASVSVFDALFNFLSNYDYIILSLHGTTMKAQNDFGVKEVARRFIDSVMISYKTVFVDFGNAYTLSLFKNLKSAQSVLLAYEDIPLTQSITAQIIMGGISSSGKIPVMSTSVFPRNTGLKTIFPIRMEYTLPEAAAMSSEKLSMIDTVVNRALNAGAFPGCQVLVARFGKIVYQKSFGTHDYSRKDTVDNADIYDIASVTKITATALAAMSLYEHKKIDLTHPISKFLPKLKNTNKGNFTLKEILTHQAGLQAWIPFYKETIGDSGLSRNIYSSVESEKFSVKVADSIYILKSYADTIRHRIYASPLSEKGKYLYSDLGPIIMKDIIEEITDETLDKYVTENFYKPLKLGRTSFNPLDKFPVNDIVQTENDTVFRHQILRGYVHDPAAAMLGGVSGNAGLFSNANDLAIIMQMLLNHGSYGGQVFLKPSTIDLFTKEQFAGNRRGLLFDKPEINRTKQSPCSPSASPFTFGHQGFTGTCIWVDPKYGLIYIFLSNRIHPNASNEKLSKMNVRTDIQEIIYKSLIEETAGSN